MPVVAKRIESKIPCVAVLALVGALAAAGCSDAEPPDGSGIDAGAADAGGNAGDAGN